MPLSKMTHLPSLFGQFVPQVQMWRDCGWWSRVPAHPFPSCLSLPEFLPEAPRDPIYLLFSPVLKDKGYTTLQDEAIKIFHSLQQLESMSDPIPIIQGILQTGHDLRPLRDELYCQLIKQTNKVPHPGSPGNLYSWQILTCLSCAFLPSRSILKYLKFHLKR